MKKILLFGILFFLYSCTTDEYGNTDYTPLIISVIVGIPVFYISIKLAESQREETVGKLAKRGLKIEDFHACGKYVGGHPSEDKEVEPLAFRNTDTEFLFYRRENYASVPVWRFSILKESIEDIAIEDATTLESKVTLGRVLLVGIFAFAWKKKKKNELAFVRIQWKEGKFKHNTLICFEGQNAMTNANSFRNLLIRNCH